MKRTKIRAKEPEKPKATTIISTDPKTYDRRATDILEKAQVIAVEIACPINPQDNIVVLKSVRDDYLLKVHSKDEIDDNGLRVGRDLQWAYENLEMGTIKAIDTTRDRVDGGALYDPLVDDRRGKALKHIEWATKVIGRAHEPIMRDFLAFGLWPGQVARKRGYDTDQMANHFSWLFKQCLVQLALASAARGSDRTY